LRQPWTRGGDRGKGQGGKNEGLEYLHRKPSLGRAGRVWPVRRRRNMAPLPPLQN
jgi:hypothetical protein